MVHSFIWFCYLRIKYMRTVPASGLVVCLLIHNPKYEGETSGLFLVLQVLFLDFWLPSSPFIKKKKRAPIFGQRVSCFISMSCGGGPREMRACLLSPFIIIIVFADIIIIIIVFAVFVLLHYYPHALFFPRSVGQRTNQQSFFPCFFPPRNYSRDNKPGVFHLNIRNIRLRFVQENISRITGMSL